MEMLVWVRTVNPAQQDRFSVCSVNYQTKKCVFHGSTAKFPSLNIRFTRTRHSSAPKEAFSFLNPPFPEFLMLIFFFSQLGDYQRAFEHLGNTLTYDPGNYKVSQRYQLQDDEAPLKANSAVRALPPMSGEAAKDHAQKACCEIWFWELSLGRELEVCLSSGLKYRVL